MAPSVRLSTEPGPDRLVTSGVSHVRAPPSGDAAHTMTVCGLREVRSVPHAVVTRST
jgi:hypothetical protein